MATQSSILTWRSLWTEEPGRLQPTGLQRVWRCWSALAHTHARHKYCEFMPFLVARADCPQWNFLVIHAQSSWDCASGSLYTCHGTCRWLSQDSTKAHCVPDNTSGFTGKESTACNSKITTISFLSTPPENFNCQASGGQGRWGTWGFLKYLVFFFLPWSGSCHNDSCHEECEEIGCWAH